MTLRTVAITQGVLVDFSSLLFISITVPNTAFITTKAIAKLQINEK